METPLKQWPKKKITLQEVAALYQIKEYPALVQLVQTLLEETWLQPVKNSGSNGKRPPLWQSYWVKRPMDDNEIYREELLYQLHPDLQRDYYLQHLEQYRQDRLYVLALNRFWKGHRSNLMQAISVNERSFQIWQQEKFLKEGPGMRILKQVGLSLQQLNVYDTTEPLAYYSHHKQTPQAVVIVENKDTFYSLRRYLLAGGEKILGLAAGTLIYGGGKKIQRTITEFAVGGEPYLLCPDNRFYYWGDLDYEGIAIFEGVCSSAAESVSVELFTAAYQTMLQKAANLQLPQTKAGQQSVPLAHFLSYFLPEEQQQIQQLLAKRLYIPQEILNIEDFESR